MLFNSISFLIFFPIITFIYFIIPYRIRYIWLLLASYFFYMSWNPLYALLILTSTIITYISGMLIDKAHNSPPHRLILNHDIKKIYVAISVILNIAILFYFKYFYFAIDNINAVLAAFHMELITPKFDIILPVGISFYTFQALSYTIDIYRQEVKAERNFLRYALFVSFFPQLVAGPIERSKNLLTQLNQRHDFNYDRMRDGLLLMLFGYFLKMVIADRAAIMVNFVFDNYEAFNGLQLVISTIAFAIQIYGDFAGYSAIAIGAAQVMGFTLMQNFNHPYFANSIQDFWRRWHISLSSWFKDYLYIPLGGSKCSKIRYYRNIMIVFIISGLWHGASWNFIIWGALHGIYQIVSDILKPIKNKINTFLNINTACFSYNLFNIAIVFILVNFAWIFFRSPDLYTAVIYIKQMTTVWNPWIFFDGSLYKMGLDRDDFWVLVFSIFILWSVSMIQERFKIRKKLAEQNLIFRWIIYYTAIIYILIFGIYGPKYGTTQFIYFQF